MQASIGESAARPIVIAVGTKTAHWDKLVAAFPSILNCCIDVRDAFQRQWDDDTTGNGFDACVRDKVMAMPTWTIVKEIAMSVLKAFRLLIVVCNWGKHRSLSLAYEVANETQCELTSPRDRNHPVRLKCVDAFMDYLSPRLENHRSLLRDAEHPVVGIHMCKVDFDGAKWAEESNRRTRKTYVHPQSLHVLLRGDLVVETRSIEDGEGWLFGSVIRGTEVVSDLWFPPPAVSPMRDYYFPQIEDFECSLLRIWYTHKHHYEEARGFADSYADGWTGSAALSRRSI